jgi:hypothetical protein
MSINSYTINYQFRIINYNSYDWHTDEEANWTALDGILETMQTALGTAAIPFVVATGAVNAYVLTYSPAITAYTAGMQISFKTNAANTGACTVNVNGLGAKSLTRAGSALASGILSNGGYVRAVYDGTNFIVVDPAELITGLENGAVTPAKLSTGHPSWDASGNLTVLGTGAIMNAPKVQQAGKQVLAHAGAYTSGNVTVSTAAPSGGSNGDLWLKI